MYVPTSGFPSFCPVGSKLSPPDGIDKESDFFGSGSDFGTPTIGFAGWVRVAVYAGSSKNRSRACFIEWRQQLRLRGVWWLRFMLPLVGSPQNFFSVDSFGVATEDPSVNFLKWKGPILKKESSSTLDHVKSINFLDLMFNFLQFSLFVLIAGL